MAPKSKLPLYEDKVRAYLKQGLGSYQIADKLGIPYSTVKDWVLKIKSPVKKSETLQKPPPRGAHVNFGENEGTASLTSDEKRVHNLESLIEACHIDMDVWKCIKFEAKIYEQGRKAKKIDLDIKDGRMSGTVHDSGKIFVQPLYSIVGKFVRREENTNEKLMEHFTEIAKSLTFRPPEIITIDPERRNILEAMVPDLHIGQRSDKRINRTADYNMQIACEYLRHSVMYMVSESHDRISKIKIPVGNDYLNVDNLRGETTKGTRQDEEADFRISFQVAGEAMIALGGDLSMNYDVEFIIVPGNHDAQRAFYLGCVLEAAFRNNPRVQVDNDLYPRKYKLYHNTMVGYTHGDQERPKDLPSLMAREEKQLWGLAEHYRFHTGHLHHERNNEVNGVLCMTFPSLVPADTWHSNSGYTMSLRRAIGLEYSVHGQTKRHVWYPEMKPE